MLHYNNTTILCSLWHRYVKENFTYQYLIHAFSIIHNGFFSKITKQNNTIITKVSSNKKGSLVSFWHSAEMAPLHQKAGTQVKELIKRYLQHSRTSIYRHAKKKLSTKSPQDHWHFNKGRPNKVSVRDHQQILKSLQNWETLKEYLLLKG